MSRGTNSTKRHFNPINNNLKVFLPVLFYLFYSQTRFEPPDPSILIVQCPRWANGTLATATPPTCPPGGASSLPSASGPTPQTTTPGHNNLQIQFNMSLQCLPDSPQGVDTGPALHTLLSFSHSLIEGPSSSPCFTAAPSLHGLGWCFKS